MLETWGLSKSYGRTQALVGLDLQVRAGEILGFLGPNGAGKSTTVKILAGLIPADSGRASIAGFDIAADPIEAKRRTGYVPETPKLYESLTADAFLDVIGALYHLDPRHPSTAAASCSSCSISPPRGIHGCASSRKACGRRS